MTVSRRAAKVLRGTRYFVLATCAENTPWAATINHVVVPAPLRLLFYSTRDAAHSVNIACNPQVAGALYLTATPERGVDGLQFTGRCREVGADALPGLHEYYYDRNFGDDETRRLFYMPVESFYGSAAHRMYLVSIEQLWIMDTTRWLEDKVDRRSEVPISDVEEAMRP